jgi:hypothetical protein
VIVEPDKAKLGELGAIFGSLQAELPDLLEGYSDEQLRTIADYLRRAAHYSYQAIARLTRQAAHGAGEEQGREP